MPFYSKNKEAEEKTVEIKEKFEREEFDEDFIRKLIANQKGKLSVKSKYYKGMIAEGNWSQIKDKEIEELDKDIIDSRDIMLGETEYRTKDAEYAYIFLPSYYAVMLLINYYLIDKSGAEKIYGLKNAVVSRDSKIVDKFYGGLPFIIKYMKKLPADHPTILGFTEIMEELIERKVGIETNKGNDEFINNIVDCISKSHCKDFILKKRIKDFKEAKDEYFCIDFKEEIDEKILRDIIVDDYRILMHRDIKKDWKYLIKEQREEAYKKILKTPRHPFNDSIEDSEKLKANLKEWYSQKISEKDRLVYKKEKKEKVVYIATVYDHYKNAEGRIKKLAAYR